MGVSYERKKVWKEEERNIVIGMITNSEFLKQIQSIYKPEFLTLDYARTVSIWCSDYFKRYGEAPFEDIQSIYTVKKDSILDETKAEEIGTFLGSLSDSFVDKKYNIEYNIDKAVSYFKEANLDLLMERVNGFKKLKDYARAEAEIANYVRVEKNQSQGVDVYSDQDAVINAIRDESSEHVLLHLPGALGTFIRPWRRGDFVAFVGPAKRGKSYWLLEIAYLCALAGLNVAFFSFEMPEPKMLMRFYQRLTGQPMPEGEDVKKVKVIYPSFDPNYEVNKIVNLREELKSPISVRQTIRKMRSLDRVVRGKKFKMICSPPNSMSVSDMRTHLDNLEYYENFIPDVVISDYADITKPERNNEKRHQIDETWLGYRALSMDKNCLVVTASHSNKMTFDRDIRQSDLSEDNRKINHVTWMGALNQSEDDRSQGVMRISIMADRYRSFSKQVEAITLQCLDVGRVCLDSRIVKKES